MHFYSYKMKIPSFEGDQFFVLGVVVAFLLMFSPDNGRLDFQGLVLVVSKDLEKKKLTDIGFFGFGFLKDFG